MNGSHLSFIMQAMDDTEGRRENVTAMNNFDKRLPDNDKQIHSPYEYIGDDAVRRMAWRSYGTETRQTTGN
jgi:hypothetical protein